MDKWEEQLRADLDHLAQSEPLSRDPWSEHLQRRNQNLWLSAINGRWKDALMASAAAVIVTGIVLTGPLGNSGHLASQRSSMPTAATIAPPREAPTTGSRQLSSTHSSTAIVVSTSQPGFGTPLHPVKVRLTGMVIIHSSGDSMACGQQAGIDGITSKGARATPNCSISIPILGTISESNLFLRNHNTSRTWGIISLHAWWNGAALTIISQTKPTSRNGFNADRSPNDRVACPAPSGGWQGGPTSAAPGIERIADAVGRGFGALAIAYPVKILAGNPQTRQPDNSTQVVVVGVVGDRNKATEAVRRVFKGNLCVVQSRTTAASIRAQDALLKAKTAGVTGLKLGYLGSMRTQNPLGTLQLSIQVIARSTQVESLVQSLGAPTVRVEPWLQPDD